MCYCTVFALYSFEFEGNFRVQACGGCGRAIYRWVLRYEFFFLLGGGGGLIFGGAYFQNFTVCLCLIRPCCLSMIFQIAGDFFSDSIDPIM